MEVVMKFSNKLSLAILITGMIVLITISYTIYKISYNSIIKSQFMYTKSIADEVSNDIDHLLYEKVKTTLTLANTPIIKKALEKSNISYADLSDEKRTKSIKLLNEKWKSTKDLTDNFILKFTDNKVSHFLKNQQALLKGEYGEIFLTNKFGALVASTSKLSTLAHGHKYWWLGSYLNGEGAVFFDDRGYDDSVGGYVLGLVVPIRKGEEIIGILKCNLNILGSVSELISGAEDKLIGKFKLTRSGGMVVFEEGFEPLSTQIHDSIFKKLKSKNNEPFIINDSGEKYVVGCSEIKLTKGEKGYGFGGTFESVDHKKGNTGESWYVLCYRQMNVVLAPITESIKSLILMGFAIILILVLVSYLFGRKIAKPLAIINKATEKIGKGDFESRIDVRRKDEFGDLAHSFNSMAGKLQQTTTTVELLENEVEHSKQTEEALRESEEKYRTLVDNLPVGVYRNLPGPTGQFLMANPAFCKMFGFKNEEEVKKMAPAELYANPKERQQYSDSLIEKRVVENDERRMVKRDGTPVHTSTTSRVVYGKDGEVSHFDSIMLDITEKQRLEAQLQQATKMEAIATLAGGVAHEFNNALMAVLGNIELLRIDLPEDERRDRSFDAMNESGHRMSRLTDQLLAYSEGGKYNVKNVKLDYFTIETLPILQHDLSPEVRVETHFPKDISYIRADHAQMQMVLSAIVANSNEAIEDVGIIKITAENKDVDDDFTKQHPGLKPGSYVCLTIEDDGKGMDEEEKEKIFEPFFTTKFQGRGMGMAAVYGIIKGHDGTITVDSELGKGTVVRIYLPAIEVKEEVKKVKQPETEIAMGEGTILIIEDEEPLVKLFKKILEILGYRVLLAETGKEAVELAKTFDGQIDLALLDIKLPDMDGGRVYPLIMEARPDMKVIVCSGYSIHGPAQDIIDAGAEGFIQKPFSIAPFAEKLKEVLEGK